MYRCKEKGCLTRITREQKTGSGYCDEHHYEKRESSEQMASKAMMRQVGGTHYKDKTCEVWTIIDEYGLDYYRGNALKYILRNKMDMYEDIEKAQHYLEKWLENNKELKK